MELNRIAGERFSGMAAMQDSDYYTDFQALLLKLSTEFINLPPQWFDRSIDEALALVGQYAGVDRCYIALFTDGSYSATRIAHEWYASYVEPISEVWPGGMSAWFVDQMKALKAVPVSRVEDLRLKRRGIDRCCSSTGSSPVWMCRWRKTAGCLP